MSHDQQNENKVLTYLILHDKYKLELFKGHYSGINSSVLDEFYTPYFSAPPVYFMTAIRPQCMTCIL